MITEIIHNFQFDVQHIIMLAGLVIVLYLAYRIGSFVLKIAVGLFVIGFAVVAAAKAWSYLSVWFI